ncbi:MAG: hypothetical protein M3Y42_05835 [Actinomycetota bacterium]|nr:hypothetical protein [Actinomycetota bacterium]MDQ2956465.1 hypothetical protein [Actinomycetota bacterium]
MTATVSESRARSRRGLRFALLAAVVAGLAVDAYVHFDLAMNYDQNKTGTLSQGELFRFEAVIAILAALAILIRPSRLVAALVALVAGSALVVLLLYRYVDISAIGPIPSMYEPIWFAEKSWSGVGEAVALLGSLGLLAMPGRPRI